MITRPERRVFVRLTKRGRRVREKGLDMKPVEAAGLKPDEFAKMQKAIVTLHGNLIRSTDE